MKEFDVQKGAEGVVFDLLARKSRKQYEKCYDDFVLWCNNNEKKIENLTKEDTLLVYYNEKDKKVRSSTLWANYSMLKSMMLMKNDIDISQYQKLRAFLKRKNDGYKPNKSKILTAEQVDQFLNQAPDKQFLMIKVALIMGIAGACRGKELQELTTDNVADMGSSILVTIKNTKNNVDRIFIIQNSEKSSIDFLTLCRNYIALRKTETNHSRFFVQYKDYKCSTQPMGKNTFGRLPQTIATFLKLPEPATYTGHCFRRTSASLLANSVANIDILTRHGGRKSSKAAEECVENSINFKQIIAESILSRNENEVKVPRLNLEEYKAENTNSTITNGKRKAIENIRTEQFTFQHSHTENEQSIDYKAKYFKLLHKNNKLENKLFNNRDIIKSLQHLVKYYKNCSISKGTVHIIKVKKK